MDVTTRILTDVIWFAPTEIQGYEEIRKGFRQVIVETMNQAMNDHPEGMRLMGSMLKEG